MVRLGLQLTLRSGREALMRALMIAAAVAIGVTVLLGVFADYHAYQATSNRACWECTHQAVGSAPSSRSELWNYSENIYKGRFIEVLDVTALGPEAPVVPGLPKVPAAGQYFASPALEDLIKSVPGNELGDRFPGSEVGTIGYQALSGPNELVAVVGYPAAKLAALPGTVTVDRIATVADVQGTTAIYGEAFWVGAIMVLFPLLILVNTATRLAAARREERFASMRLVGATGRQVNIVAAVESAVSAVFGTLLGIAAFLAVRPGLAQISFSGARFFERTVTPTAGGYAAMLVGVPLVATVSSLWSLRRVRVSPLGVSRKVTPPPPRAWRVLPLLVGVPLFVVPLLGGYKNLDNVKSSPTTPLLYVGAFLIMAGLVLGGPWLTMQAARALAKFSRGAASLLASRRLADNPKAAFRTVSGLVLAVFVGSLLAAIVPVLNAAQTSLGGNASSLTNVLRVPYSSGPGAGLLPAEATRLIGELRGRPGVTVLAVYDNPSYQPEFSPRPSALAPNGRPERQYRTSGGSGGYDSIVNCASLRAFPALGRCAPGARAVQADVSNDLLTDNPLTMDLPVVDHANPVAAVSPGGLSLGMLLVKTNDAATLEKVRTLLTLFNANAVGRSGGITNWQMGNVEPETFGELAQIRNNDDNNAENVVLAIVGLTLLMAACSLAVTVGGSILERKRPFTLLRLSGTPGSTLYRVVVLESVLPLVTASLVAAATGIGVAIPLVKALPKLHNEPSLALPGPAYYLAMAAGLVAALVVVSSALPFLRRVTRPNSARFE